MRPASLYERLLGGRYGDLPPAVQRFHRLGGEQELVGDVEVDAPQGRAARLLAWCIGAPRSAQRGALRFHLSAGTYDETSVRHFPARTMRSRLSAHRGRLALPPGAPA